jgi:hypothetical protein
MVNPRPQFLFSRLMKMLHSQGQVNRQALVPATESWQFFLTDSDRLEIQGLAVEERAVSERIQSGPGMISDHDVRIFYQRYRAKIESFQAKASNKMWLVYKDKGRDHCQTWKLLKRMRVTSRAVPIEPGRLLSHFRNIFFDPSRPLAVHYPGIEHRPAFGPFLAADYHLSDVFSEDELEQALRSLNTEAGVGPGRVSSKWLVKIFSTPGAKDYLRFFFNQCFLWGECPCEWSYSELFVIYKGKGDPTDPTNYRAINLLDDFYRLYSRLLYKRLTGWASRYNYFSPAQFGFRSQSGTLEAVLSLQTVVRSWQVSTGQPVLCVFIDIKKAFPSVDRVRLINLLHDLGLAGPMVRALASTFTLNECSLRIEGFLSEVFPVNLGVREGDIDSPPMFNLVYGEILRVCGLGDLNESVFSVSIPRAIGIAYADDLAMLVMEGEAMQNCLFDVSDAMLPFNLKINAGKSNTMVFLTTRRSIPAAMIPDWCDFFVEEEWITPVEEFKYLGIHLDFLGNTAGHTTVCLNRAKQAATQIGLLCRQLRIVDFSRLRTYFFSFIISQFHGSQIVTFPWEYYEEVLMLFFRRCFSLPIGYPRAIFYFFVGSMEFDAQQIMARYRFFQKHCRSNGFLRSVLFEDRKLFLLGQPSWSMDFKLLYENFLPGRTFGELDLFDPQDDIRELLERESSDRRDLRLSLMPSGVLFRDLLPYQVMPSFLRELSRRSFEEVRLVLIFFANMFRFCFFVKKMDLCPLCYSEFVSSHLFECPEIVPSIPVDCADWRVLAVRRDWGEFLDLFFVVCLFWTRRLNSIRVGHVKTIGKAVRLFLV